MVSFVSLIELGDVSADSLLCLLWFSSVFKYWVCLIGLVIVGSNSCQVTEVCRSSDRVLQPLCSGCQGALALFGTAMTALLWICVLQLGAVLCSFQGSDPMQEDGRPTGRGDAPRGLFTPRWDCNRHMALNALRVEGVKSLSTGCLLLKGFSTCRRGRE